MERILSEDSSAAAPSGPPPVIRVEALSKSFHISRMPRAVLRSLSFSVAAGEFVAVMGQSGVGKSTLLHIMGGLEPPDSGRVVIDGRDVYAMGDAERSAFRRDHVGFVFQFFNLVPSLTAAENVALPLRLRTARHGDGAARLDRHTIAERVNALMDLLSLRGLQGHGPEEISGGEQQRVAIARALAAAPTLLLADEPTGNLDRPSGDEVMGLLSRLCRERSQTTVLATHNARVAARADRVLVLQDGALVDDIVIATGTHADAGAFRELVGRLERHDL
ncbi:MAG TPA: ABC transporter ATP-binding protein [Candidatus Binatia bacterium]|nr:ABC transporter ATP-binding protein [Candidatus Binatia bacterium]